MGSSFPDTKSSATLRKPGERSWEWGWDLVPTFSIELIVYVWKDT